MSSSDIHLTLAGIKQLMLINTLISTNREKYIDRILLEDGILAHVLAISASDLTAYLPDEIGDTQVGVCNVSKVLEVFLQAAFGVHITECDFTEEERILFEVFNSPAILGVTARKLSYIAILPETYISIPYLLGARPLPTKDNKVLTCGVCHRRMKSVVLGEGVCMSCKKSLQEYTFWRTEPFYISRNYLNFPGLGKDTDPEIIQFSFNEWEFKDELNGITANPVGISPGTQRLLPIEEYQKPIH